MLQSSSVTATVPVISGCFSDDETIVLDYILVVNWDRDRAHTARLSVKYNGETIHERNRQLEPIEDDVADFIKVNDLPESAGEYAVNVELPNKDVDPLVISPAEKWETDCTTIYVCTWPVDEEIQLLHGRHQPCKDE